MFKPVLFPVAEYRNIGMWVNCEDGYNFPPENTPVPVMLRSFSGMVMVSGAVWVNMTVKPERFMDVVERLRFVDTLRWYSINGNPLRGVVGWYNVPVCSAETLREFLAGNNVRL